MRCVARRTGEEREHVWEGSTHPEGEVELCDGKECEENALAGTETARHGASEERQSECVQAGENEARCLWHCKSKMF